MNNLFIELLSGNSDFFSNGLLFIKDAKGNELVMSILEHDLMLSIKQFPIYAN